MTYKTTPSVARRRSFGKKSGFTPSSTRYGCMLRTWNTTSHAGHIDPAMACIEGHRHLGIELVAPWMAAGRMAVGKGISADVREKKKVGQVKAAVAIAHPCEHRAMIEPDNSSVAKRRKERDVAGPLRGQLL